MPSRAFFAWMTTTSVVLTLKEPVRPEKLPADFPEAILEVQANFFVVTEWKKEGAGQDAQPGFTRADATFTTPNAPFVSYLNTSDSPASAQDKTEVDDSKEAQIQSLGEALKELEVKGNYFGEFSLTVVVYATC